MTGASSRPPAPATPPPAGAGAGTKPIAAAAVPSMYSRYSMYARLDSVGFGHNCCCDGFLFPRACGKGQMGRREGDRNTYICTFVSRTTNKTKSKYLNVRQPRSGIRSVTGIFRIPHVRSICVAAQPSSITCNMYHIGMLLMGQLGKACDSLFPST